MTWVWRHRGIFTSQPVARLTGIVHGNAPGEATKKQLVFGRLMSLSATCSQGSADRQPVLCETHIGIAQACRPLLVLVSLYTEATQPLLTWELY